MSPLDARIERGGGLLGFRGRYATWLITLAGRPLASWLHDGTHTDWWSPLMRFRRRFRRDLLVLVCPSHWLSLKTSPHCQNQQSPFYRHFGCGNDIRDALYSTAGIDRVQSIRPRFIDTDGELIKLLSYLWCETPLFSTRCETRLYMEGRRQTVQTEHCDIGLYQTYNWQDRRIYLFFQFECQGERTKFGRFVAPSIFGSTNLL